MLLKGYVSGGMTGLPNYNSDAFNDAAHELACNGFMFVNPINLTADIVRDVEAGKYPMPIRYTFMRMDIKELCDCDFILMLKGWQKSWGAKWERIIAKYVFGMPVFESVSEVIEWRKTLVDELENNN